MTRSAVLVYLALLTPAIGRAGLIVSERFDYTAGSPLDGLNGGVGWAAGWGTPGGLGASAVAASLGYGALLTSGGAVATPVSSGNVTYYYRDLASPIGADGQELYWSFLLRPDSGYGFYGGLNLSGGAGTIFVGRSGNESVYGLENGSGGKSLSSTTVAESQTVLLVVRLRFQAGADIIDLYVNPAAGGSMPALPSATLTGTDLGTLNYLALNNAGRYTTDEIVIGTDWASVTAPADVPEPSSFALAGLALFGVLGAARRRS